MQWTHLKQRHFHFTCYQLHCAPYTMHCALCIVHCAHCTLCSAQYAQCAVHQLQVHYMYRQKCSQQCSSFPFQFLFTCAIMYCVLRMHTMQCVVCSIMYTLCVLHIEVQPAVQQFSISVLVHFLLLSDAESNPSCPSIVHFSLGPTKRRRVLIHFPKAFHN